jgi:signal transduction histidine kinase
MLARQAADFIERLHAEQAHKATRDELARANADLERKVLERTARLRETIGELEHFSYTLVHDMRAPLRAMQGFAELLMLECETCLKPGHKDYLHRIATSADRMDHLIIDALDYTKAMQQDIPVHPVDVDALLRGILKSYPDFQPPNAQIEISGPIPAVIGNEAALTQCFSNLLGNAIKFVKPNTVPKVHIWAEKRNDALVRLWFEDQGIGIPRRFHERIFDMFQQVNKEKTGTGIGLALVRKITEQMGGRVGVESEPGQGSRFWLELKPAEVSGNRKHEVISKREIQHHDRITK